MAMLNINSCSASNLYRFEGWSEQKATEILDIRDKKGFLEPTDLMNVGVGPELFAQIRFGSSRDEFSGPYYLMEGSRRGGCSDASSAANVAGPPVHMATPKGYSDACGDSGRSGGTFGSSSSVNSSRPQGEHSYLGDMVTADEYVAGFTVQEQPPRARPQGSSTPLGNRHKRSTFQPNIWAGQQGREGQADNLWPSPGENRCPQGPAGPSHWAGPVDSSPYRRGGDKWEPPTRRKANLPKTIFYDGKGNWQAFLAKFSTFAREQRWSGRTSKVELGWCLDGKASEFYTTLLERDPELEYYDMVSKMEARFGFRELPETTQIQFLQATQNAAEPVVEWADRVLTLATRAFPDLPDVHVFRQAILRFCQGLADKEAGKHTINRRPSSIEEAIDTVRWFQHTNQAIYGTPTVAAKQLCGDRHPEFTSRVRETYSATVEEPSQLEADKGNASLAGLDARVEALESKVSALDSKIDKLGSNLQLVLEEIQQLSSRPTKTGDDPLAPQPALTENTPSHSMSSVDLNSPGLV